ncbi:MAG: glycosyltransferase family 4 protein, partial [Patescibacteria group bacterium]
KFKIQNSKFKIRFVGHRPWAEIPLWLKAADVLVLPNTGRMRVSQYYTSPMKLFEYMASGRPIVASDIPSIREIVDETMVFFATADDPESFAQVIQQTLNRPGEARSRVEKSLAEVKKYTWDNRATRLLEPMHKL